MSSFPVNIKIEHNNSFSDHDYCYKESAIVTGMDEENHTFFVDVENDDDYNESGRKRRNIKQPELYNSIRTSSTGKKTSKSKPRGKSGGKVVKYEVEFIWGKRTNKTRQNKFEYQVKWKGYPIEQSTWEPEDNLRLCQESIDRYEKSEVYFNDKGEKEMRLTKTQKNAMAENGVKVVVVNGAKPLKKVLPTMQARRAPPTSKTVSVPSLPKSHKTIKNTFQSKKVEPIKRTPSPSVQSLSEVSGAKKRKLPTISHFNGISSGRPFQMITTNDNKKESNGETTAKTLEELAVKLQSKTVDEIISHEPSDIDGVPFVFRARYGDGKEKRVIMRDLLDIAPRTLASYLAVALKRAEGGDND